MKRALLFFALNFMVGFVFSQTWCPPGATWYFRAYQPFSSSNYVDGHVKLQVTNTVAINNTVCQNMHGVFTGIMPSPASPVSTSTFINIKTYENNKVVYLYNTYTQAFDTIANFNAAIGDKWLKIHFVPSSNCLSGTRLPITVLDTGRISINNISLKTLTLSVPFSTSGNYTITMLERIMNINGFLFPWNACQVDNPPYGDFICYSDNNFASYNPTSAICAYVPTGIHENSLSAEDLKLYPNPTKNDFSMDLRLPSLVRIFNGLGALVSTSDIDQAGSVTIKSGDLQPGIYFLKLENADGSGFTKFIRE